MEAEDILVTSFIKIFEKIGQFKTKEALKDGSGGSLSTKPFTFLRRNGQCTWKPNLNRQTVIQTTMHLSDHLEAEDY